MRVRHKLYSKVTPLIKVWLGYSCQHMSTSSQTAPNASGLKSDIECALCGRSDGNRMHLVREMMYGTREEFIYLECSSCHCLQRLDVPADLSIYYPSNYYSFAGGVETWKPTIPWRKYAINQLASYNAGRRNLIGWYISKRFPHWHTPKWTKIAKIGLNDPIIDVGCGTGGALHALHDLGYRNLCGIDPFIPSDLAYPNNVTVYKRFPEDHQGSYKLLLVSHVYEHMLDPEESLRQFARLIERGSFIVLSIPVFPNALWDMYGINWVGIDAPRHLFLHNEMTITLLAAKVGLTVERVDYDTTMWNVAASEGYKRGIPLAEMKPKKCMTKPEMHTFAELAEDINKRRVADQATFYLRKI
jgi:hypothetical protein